MIFRRAFAIIRKPLKIGGIGFASWRGILIGKELHWKCSAPKGVACSSHVLSASGESPRAIRACSFAGALIFVPATHSRVEQIKHLRVSGGFFLAGRAGENTGAGRGKGPALSERNRKRRDSRNAGRHCNLLAVRAAAAICHIDIPKRMLYNLNQRKECEDFGRNTDEKQIDSACSEMGWRKKAVAPADQKIHSVRHPYIL